MMEKIGKYITNYIKGKTPKVLFDSELSDTLPYLSPDYLRGVSNPELYAKQDAKTIVIDDGEVIVLWDGSNAGEILISKKGILASTMTMLKFDETKINKAYFGYSFQNLEYILKAKTAGSGIPHADKGVISKLEFYKPSLSEQTAIADILSKVDEAIEAVQGSIAAAERLKKSLMQNLLTGRMKPDGTLRKEDEFYVDEKFGRVPVGWGIEKFGKRVIVLYGKSQKDVVSENGTIPVYGTGGIIEYATQALCNHESILVGRKGTIDKPFYIDKPFWAVDTTYYVDRFIDGNMRYLYYMLLRMNLGNLNEATGVPSVTRRTLNRQRLIIPPIDEQNSIVNVIDKIEKQIIKKQSRITTLERLKKSLMQNLLTGRVRVKE